MLFYTSRLDVKDHDLVGHIRAIARENPSWGYRHVWGALRGRGIKAGKHRIHRLWRLHGLSLTRRKRSRKRITGKTLDPKALKNNDVWCADFVHDSCLNGQNFRALTIKDEASAYALAVEVRASFTADDVKHELARLFSQYGRPRYWRSDNGGELVAADLQRFLRANAVEPCPIKPGTPWNNGSSESFNGTYRREVLDAEIFINIPEATILSRSWRTHYNYKRPHSRLDYKTPAEVYLGQ
jgi:putative transposase